MSEPKIINETIEADDSGNVSDDGYGSSVVSDTTSVSSTIRQYIEENGRTYHKYKEGKYLTPNDEAERDRLDFYHHTQLQIMGGKLYLAPICKNPQRILDCGTGTGIWAIDMGEKFPSAEVIGLDLSPIQPTWVFPNVRFEIDDLEDEWTFPKNHFDFIHTRQVITGIRNMPRYFQQLYDHLVPGGYFEFSESGFDLRSDDGSLTAESKLGYQFDQVYKAMEKAGIHFADEKDIAKFAEEAGFVDIKIERIKQPWGPWPKNPALKKVGKMVATIAAESCESYGLQLLTRFGDKTEEEVRQMARDVGEEVCSKKSGVHAYNILWHVYGRKPGNQE